VTAVVVGFRGAVVVAVVGIWIVDVVVRVRRLVEPVASAAIVIAMVTAMAIVIVIVAMAVVATQIVRCSRGHALAVVRDDPCAHKVSQPRIRRALVLRDPRHPRLRDEDNLFFLNEVRMPAPRHDEEFVVVICRRVVSVRAPRWCSMVQE